MIHYRARVRSSALQFFYWLLHVLCYVPNFKQVQGLYNVVKEV